MLRRPDRRRVLLALLAAGLPVRIAAQTTGPVLLMFEKDGCPWCQRWHQEVGVGYPKSDEGLAAPLRVIHGLSPDAGVVLKAPVTMAPTFVLVDNGREVGRIVGYPGADFFYGLLGELLKKRDRAAAIAPRFSQLSPKLPS